MAAAPASARGSGEGGHRAVIQATLIFLLGFLGAGFLAVLVAPSIWRRAVKLTRRRIEAALPLSMAEIRADKDAARAQYAMATRKLEVTVETLKEEIAAQSLEVDRAREETRRTLHALDEKEAARAELERRERELRAELRQAQEEAARLSEALAGRDRALEERAAELEKLGAMYDEASFNASERQIELVAREADVERLTGELSTLREEHRQADARLREAGAQIRELEQAVRGEKRRVVVLERNAGKLTAALSDREEKLDRRERDLDRLREKLKEASESGRKLAARLSAAQDRQARLEQDLAVQARESKALRAVQDRKWGGPAAAGSDGGGEGGADRVETALLRERINDLAAEVVSLTARLEGPDSPIHKALAADAGDAGTGAAGGVSLAERIRALQKAAGAKTAG